MYIKQLLKKHHECLICNLDINYIAMILLYLIILSCQIDVRNSSGRDGIFYNFEPIRLAWFKH